MKEAVRVKERTECRVMLQGDEESLKDALQDGVLRERKK